MKIVLRIQQYQRLTDGQTDGRTEWLLELLVGAKNSLPTSCDQAINKFSKQPASVVGDVLVESGFEVVPVVDEVDPEVVGTAVDPVLH